jgi:hypothetical protein
MSTRNKPGRAKRPKKARAQLPDLEAAFEAFIDANALVVAACRLLEEGGEKDRGPAVFVLRQGVDALERISDQLEEVHIKLSALRRKRGAS